MSQIPSPDDQQTIPPRVPSLRERHGQLFISSSFLGHTLPEGTRIGGLEIIRLIGEGGFGIVYLANDPAIQRHVAVKEYLPSSLAARVNGGFDVVVKSADYAETFELGLKSFVNEARLLARFDHPSLVKVYGFWEANGTAYMSMPYYEGPTLKRALFQRGYGPDEATLREWLRPLLNALQLMHSEQCLHRDIAPDNILLTPSGPLLLDFGAARHVISGMTHALTAVLKPGYAPIEQYSEMSTLSQGPWTDLYALASVVYYAVTGKPPMSSVDRLMADSLVPFSRVAAGRYSESFLRAIDAALAVRPEERPQNVAQFRALLEAEPPLHASATASAALQPQPQPMADQSYTPTQAAATVQLEPRAAAPATAAAGAALLPRRTLYALAAAACVAAIAVGALFVRSRPAPPPERAPPATAAVAPVPPAAPAAPLPGAAGRPAIQATPEPSESVLSAPPPGVAAATADPPLAQTLPLARPRVEPAEPRPAIAVAPIAAPPAKLGGQSARCSDILQKASLEGLTPEEAAYLRRECR